MAPDVRRAWRSIATYLAAAPGTHILFLVVTVTTLVLRGVDASTATRVLRQQSTNLLHMSTDAPRVLVLSAFLLDQGHLWKVLLIFTAVMVPVERWIGTYRWIVVFATGHIGATLATTVGIWLQVRAGVGSRELTYVVDVGVSYGVAAAAGVLAFRLPRPASWLLGLGLLGLYVAAVARSGTFTDWGHLCAFLIGMAVAPLVRPRSPRTTATPGPARAALGWLRWLTTPPAVTQDRNRRRTARIAGLTLLAIAAGTVTLMLTTNDDVDLQPSPTAQKATVLGGAPGCSRRCDDVTVDVGSTTGVLRLPLGTDVRPGSHVVVRSVPLEPGIFRLAAISRRVDVTGFLGEMAVVAGASGLALLATLGGLGRRRHTSPGVTVTEADGSDPHFERPRRR
jgi:hypothetical protein